MAKVIVTLKIMPEDTSTDIKTLEDKAKKSITHFGGDVGKVEIEPIAFGLKALKLIFVMDENKGSTETLEKDVSKIKGVGSVEISDVRRAIG